MSRHQGSLGKTVRRRSDSERWRWIDSLVGLAAIRAAQVLGAMERLPRRWLARFKQTVSR